MTTMGKMDDPYVEEIGEGVFAYIQPDGTWFLNNTGIILGAETVLMIDQTSTVDRARALMDMVAQVGGDRAVAGLVNTHHHGDHTFGNFLLPTTVPIYGHELAREDILATGTSVVQFFEGPEWGDIIIRAPDVTFTDRLTVWAGERRIELIHFGTPAHTTNDVVAYLPDERIVFAGDLLFNGGMPFALQGSVVGWIGVMDQLADLDAGRWVPGHGPVSDGGNLAVVKGYLELVRDTAEQARAAGISPLEASQQLDLGEYSDLDDDERLVGNMHRAFADLEDPDNLAKPLVLPPIIADMRTYNGGPIVAHA